MERVKVAIVGGGITGLTAAYELHQQGVHFRLFETSSRLGGLILTEKHNGFTIDAGPDSLLVQKPSAIELCQELGLGERLQTTLIPRTAYILKKGALHALPETSVLGIPTRLTPLFTSGLLSPLGRLRFALDLILPRKHMASLEDESIADFFTRRFGKESVDYVAEPLLATIHAGDVNRLSMRALFPRLLEAEQSHGSLIRGLNRRGTAPMADGMFRSLPGGLGEMTEALVSALPPERLSPSTRVISIDDNGPFVVRTTGDNTIASAVILAIPASGVTVLLEAQHPKLAKRCLDIPHNSTATVALTYPRSAIKHTLLGSGFVVPRVETGLSIIAATWVSSKWPDRAPAGQVLIRAFIGGARNPDILNRIPNDKDLAQLAHRNLARILKIECDPQFSRVYRWRNRSPQYEVGHLERLASIDHELRHTPSLFITGTSFRGIGIPDCIADGRATARAAARVVQSDRNKRAENQTNERLA